MQKSTLGVLICALAILVVGCSPPASQLAAQSGPVAWIDAPLNGTTLPLAPYEVVFHGSASSGVGWVEFSVDGTVLFGNAPPDAGQSLVTVRQVWSPQFPGNYTLQARAQDQMGVWGEYATAVVTVEGEVSSQTPSPTACIPSASFSVGGSCHAGPATDHPAVANFSPDQTALVNGRNGDGSWWRITIPSTAQQCWIPASSAVVACPEAVPVVEGPTLVPPTYTPTFAPTWTPTFAPVIPVVPIVTDTPVALPPVIAPPSASTDVFYSDNKCGGMVVVISAIVDDPSGVSSVTLNYQLKDKTSGAETEWTALPMDRLFSTQATHANWMRSLDAQKHFANANSSHEYALRYYVVAANALGLTAQTPIYENVTFKTYACVH